MASKSNITKGPTKAVAKKPSKSTKLRTKSPAKAAPKSATKVLAAIKGQSVKIDYLVNAAKFSSARRSDAIHPRKILPKVRKGSPVKDLIPTPRHLIEESAPSAQALTATAPQADSDTLSLVLNTQLVDLATHDTVSHVCEPSVAINDKVIVYTGNWFAAVSTDGGVSFKYVDPFTAFPDPPGMGFCCDQVVHYIKKIDTFVWLLQYTKDNSGKNIQRIAFAKTAKVVTGEWRFFDVTPAAIGLPAGVWLDFPDLADGKNALYMTSNCFEGNLWIASVVVRIKLTSFTSGTLAANAFLSKNSPSLRVAQNCDTTAYFASHTSTSQLRVFSWKETAAAPTSKDISVASWAAGTYSSITPDNLDWLARADARHTGATRRGNEVWFAWGSNKGGANARPNPFVQIARIDVSNMTLIQNINLWDPNSAICYAALATNGNNEVGVSHAIGGGPIFPRHVVGILTGTPRSLVTFSGNRGPTDNKWGDYLTVRRYYPNQKLFCASGYIVVGGTGTSDATPNVTLFGRSSDVT